MSEQPSSNPNLPSGFISVETYPEAARITPETMPWLNEDTTLSLVHCEIQGGGSFLFANAVGTHPKLVDAADAMSEQQTTNANNMFYSRIQDFVQRGHSSHVETMQTPSTDFSIHVMRNKSGQRVYFGQTILTGVQSGDSLPVLMRLGVCDKNKQGLVMSVLSGLKASARRAKTAKGSK